MAPLPSALLRFERVYLHGEFGRDRYIRQEDELPALHLRTVAQVEVFSEGVVLPAARVFDVARRSTPAVPLKLKKPSAHRTGVAFEHEMPVEEYRLGSGQERVLAVQGVPTAPVPCPTFGSEK